jgi:hypothetical protein
MLRRFGEEKLRFFSFHLSSSLVSREKHFLFQKNQGLQEEEIRDFVFFKP